MVAPFNFINLKCIINTFIIYSFINSCIYSQVSQRVERVGPPQSKTAQGQGDRTLLSPEAEADGGFMSSTGRLSHKEPLGLEPEGTDLHGFRFTLGKFITVFLLWNENVCPMPVAPLYFARR